MSQRPLSDKIKQDILTLLKEGVTQREIAAQLRCAQGSVSQLACEHGLTNRTHQPKTGGVEPETHQEVIKALKRGPLSTLELADALDLSPRRVTEAIDAMKKRGVMVYDTPGGKIGMHDAAVLEPGRSEIKSTGADGYWTHRLGLVGDQHMCNKHHRADVLRDAYNTFEREGITDVYNAGNYIDGEARFNKMELITPPGLRHQLQYVIDNYPQKKGITTHYIDGDDHEGWAAQREGVIPGRVLEMMAKDQGRSDLHFLGYAECDIKLQARSGSAVFRLAHPGGGSSYATSYAPQKIVESLQGGEKPQILALGHYHKMGYFYPREVATLLVPCMTDQSLFMRKHKIQAHIGFVILNIRQNQGTGAVEEVCPRFFPYFDRGYYKQNYE